MYIGHQSAGSAVENYAGRMANLLSKYAFGSLGTTMQEMDAKNTREKLKCVSTNHIQSRVSAGLVPLKWEI
jgi:hypothetical protein